MRCLEAQRIQHVFSPSSSRRPYLTLVQDTEAPLFNLSSYRHAYRTYDLLAAYFLRQSAAKESAELAGRLLFPENPRGAALVQLGVKDKGASPESAELRALALFPRDESLARRFEEQERAGQVVDVGEWAALYSARAFPGVAAVAKRFPEELERCLDSLRRREASPADRIDVVCALVQAERGYHSASVATSSELAQVFGLDRRVIEREIKTRLGEDFSRWREERLAERKAAETFSLSNLRISAIRSLVSTEIELHRLHAISQLSNHQELAALFDVSVDQMKHYLRFVPLEDTQYRNKVLKAGDETQIRSELARSVHQEIYQHQARPGKIRSDEDLAKIFGINAGTVHLSLLRDLPEKVRRLRDAALANQGAISPSAQSPVAFVRNELAAFERSEVDRVHTDAEIARLFGLSTEDVTTALRGSSQPLSIEEARVRRFIQQLQHPEDPGSRAMRGSTTRDQVERVLKSFVKIFREKGVTPPVIEKRLREGRSPARYSYADLGFDSLDEAACGILLQRYVLGRELKPGVELQVSVGKWFLDFVLQDVVIEYHPIVLRLPRGGPGVFKTWQEYEHFRKQRDRVPRDQRRDFIEDMRQQYTERYRAERQAIINLSPELRNKRLIVVTSKEEFYFEVIRRLSKNPPTKVAFDRQWASQRRLVKLLNGFELTQEETRGKLRGRPKGDGKEPEGKKGA